MKAAAPVEMPARQPGELHGRGLPEIRRIPFSTLMRGAATAVLVAIALATPGFATTANITAFLTAISFVGFVACGMTLITISGNVMSFSLGITVATASVVFATVYNSSGMFAAVLAALAAAAFVNGVQGLVIGGLRANPIIVSISALALTHGAMQAMTSGLSVSLVPGAALDLMRGKVLGLPVEFVVLLTLAAVSQLVLGFTVFGRRLFMVGDGAAAATTVGIRNWWVVTRAYTLAGLFCGVPAMLLAARFGSGTTSYGEGYDYAAIAAILVGGAAIQGGRGSIIGTCFGVAFIALVQTLLVLHGAQQEWQVFGLGVIVFAIILVTKEAGESGAAPTTIVLRTPHAHLRPLILVVGTVAGFSLLDSGHFLTAATAFSALQQFATIGPVALALGLTMLVGEFDLSVAGMFGLAGCVAVLTGAEHPALGVALALLTGAIGGGIQGLIISRLSIGSISVTLGGLLLFIGASYVLTQSHSISYDNLDFALAVDAPIAAILSWRSLIAIAAFLVAAVLVGATRIGRDMIAMGSDRRAAMYSGVNVNLLLVGTFTVSGMLAALAGTLLSYGLASASPSGLSDVLVPATAAAILGGVSLSGGVGRPLGIALGVLTLAIVRSGLNGLGASSAIGDIVTGGVLFGVAVIDGGTFARYMTKWRGTRALARDKGVGARRHRGVPVAE